MDKKERGAWQASSIGTDSVEDGRKEAEGGSMSRSNRSDNRSKDRSCSLEDRGEAVRVVLVEEDREVHEEAVHVVHEEAGRGRDSVDPWGADG